MYSHHLSIILRDSYKNRNVNNNNKRHHRKIWNIDEIFLKFEWPWVI